MEVKRYTDRELDRFEDQIDVLEKRKNLFLILGITFIVTGPLFFIFMEIGVLGILTDISEGAALTFALIYVLTIVYAYLAVPGGIVMLILRKVLIMRRIRNLDKLINDELDRRDEEKAK